jgi:hypothetical protein
MAAEPTLTDHDRIVEDYELLDLVARIQRVLSERGVLTVADYQQELAAVRNGAQEHSPNYGA